MEPEKRINKDLKIFEENIIPVEELELSDEEVQVKEMAKRYYEDTKSYFKIEDFLTSFACIAYAHGLLDSLRIMHDLIEDS